jgi:hypothetical protein
MNKYGNRRKHIRIMLDDYDVQMTIVKIGSKEIKTGYAQVIVCDISCGGLKFTTHLNLPNDLNISIGLIIKAYEYEINLSGKIIYKSKTCAGIFEYGVCFTDVDQFKLSQLKRLLSSTAARTNRYFIKM